MRFWITVLSVMFLDQITKWWIASNYQVGESHPLLGNWLYLTYVQNRGAAFGILPGQAWFFLAAAALVILGLIIYNHRYTVEKPVQIWTGLLVAGAAGNFIDRWRLQYVIDFLDLRWWPVFNLADAAVVVGGILLVIHILFFVKEG
ncbi:MAG TPA: signal peptidase II [Syntrophomonadaceae bacterium]|nr:signal peptidase II [Syntrophomonadaceae bacterium]HOQ08917.1 signal peptidase II [Syntrophomonadaceae bacterium]HPU47728.1 signal peptidase II [Syntrophomonadaceae bacterium]